MWELDHKESWTLNNWCFWTVVLKKTLEGPLVLILKEVNPEYSFEGLRLKLKYFGHLMQRADSLEKTLMLGKIEGRRRREQQRMRWLDGIVRDQTTGSRTWVMFIRKRQDMRSSCLAKHVMPATPVTETKNCLYISHHTPLFGALVRFPCVGWDLGPSALGINKLPSCVCNTVVDLLSQPVRRYGLRA